MKKFGKIIKKAGIAYLICDGICLAVFGYGCVVEKMRDMPYLDAISEVINDTKIRYQRYWNS